MTSKVGPHILDYGLTKFAESDKIYFVSADPATFEEATSTYALGSKNFGVGLVFGAPADATPTGRKVASIAFDDGVITDDGTVIGWAVVTSSQSRLDANGRLGAPRVVTEGVPFDMLSFYIRLPSQQES